MSLFVPAAAPASTGAQNISASPSAGQHNNADGGFSSHFDAQQGSTQRKSSRAAAQASSESRKASREPSSKPTTAGSAGENTESAESRKNASVDVADKSATKQSPPDKKANSVSADTSKASRADSETPGPLANKGLQNAPAVGLVDRARELPLASMGGQVLSLLAAGGDEAGAESENSAAPIDALMAALGGNESPQQDEALPQHVLGPVVGELDDALPAQPELVPLASAGGELELLPTQGQEILAPGQQALSASVQQVMAKLDVRATALREANAALSDDLAELNPLAPSLRPNSERPLNANLALSALAPSGVKTLAGKQSGEASEIIDGDVELGDVELNTELDLLLNPGKTTKVPLLEGSASKLPPTVQAVSEAVSNSLGAKDSFAQVRQNIMAAMAGKSELPNPLNLAISGAGHEAADTTPQSLNVSNLSASLSAPSVDTAKYTAAQDIAPQRSFTLQTPAGQLGWDVEVGNRIRWMVGQNNSGVELRLNPPELGSIEVKVATDGDRTSITFFSANPAAREALEAALPRLREMFADSGMQLANADVSDQGLQQQREQQENTEDFAAQRNSAEAMILDAGPGFTEGRAGEGRGLIDYYI